MKIINLTDADIEAVSNLHQNNLVSPGSKLGPTYLNSFYRLLLSDTKLQICLLAKEKGKVVGVISATRNLTKTRHLLNKLYSPKLVIITLRAILTGKVGLLDLIKRAIFEYILINKFGPDLGYILALAVDKKYQRKGIGKRLFKRLISILKKQNIDRLYVDTLKDNKNALNFYLAMGFTKKAATFGNIVLEYQLK